MRKIAVIGATSAIAQDLIRGWVDESREVELYLYARNMSSLSAFRESLAATSHSINLKNIDTFPDTGGLDVVINFVGAGDPAKISSVATSIIDVTNHYDELVLGYLKKNPSCQYIFLSSGAAYGSDFSEPADATKKASFDINRLGPADYYGVSKFLAEAKHRCCSNLRIVDIRVFNYFSRGVDLNSRYFVADVLRAVMHGELCSVLDEPMVRDFIGANDFCQIIDCVMSRPDLNVAFDCYSKAPVDKFELLNAMANNFGLKWLKVKAENVQRATGNKVNYISNDRALADIGYSPKYTSLETLINEFSAILTDVVPAPSGVLEK